MSTPAHTPTKLRAIPQWSFGDRMRKIRRDLFEMEQQEFALLLGVSKVTYGMWETGGRKPRDLISVANQVERLADVPGLAAWLVGVPTGVISTTHTVAKVRASAIRPGQKGSATRRPPSRGAQDSTRPPRYPSMRTPRSTRPRHGNREAA